MYNLSHLLNSEAVNVTDRSGTVLFTCVVREITHGQRTAAQRAVFQNLNASNTSKREIDNAMLAMLKTGQMLESALYEELAAIESWTLQDADGNPVPVCREAWEALPRQLAAQIEAVIERLNPAVDEDSKSDAGSESGQ